MLRRRGTRCLELWTAGSLSTRKTVISDGVLSASLRAKRSNPALNFGPWAWPWIASSLPLLAMTLRGRRSQVVIPDGAQRRAGIHAST